MISPSLQPALTRAQTALERGQGVDAAQALARILRPTTLSRDDELALRSLLAEAWLLQDVVRQASVALGRSPETLRESIPPVRLSALWLLHGRVASARGDQSRAIALYGRALRQAELAHDPRSIGLAQYQLGLAYKQVGDAAIVREHLSKAAAALHAAGDRRHLALVHSVSGVILAQAGRYDEAILALRQAERLAAAVPATDVLAMVCGNQANVALMRHRHDQALALAERSVSLHEEIGSVRGLAVALATLGQICVRLGDLTRAEQVLHRALEVRGRVPFQTTMGAVLDSLAQIHLIRGSYDEADDYLRRAEEAYGSYGQQTSRWYEWSIKVLGARLALRRQAPAEALRRAEEIVESPGVPPDAAVQAELIACEAQIAADKLDQAATRLDRLEQRIDARTAPGAWAEYLRDRGALHAATGRTTEAHHDLAQSANLFELIGERYQAAQSHLRLSRLSPGGRSRSGARRHLAQAVATFEALGAEHDLDEARIAATHAVTPAVAADRPVFQSDAEDVIVRRLVNAAALPDLLGREIAAAMLEASDAEAAVIFVQLPAGEVRVLAAVGCDPDVAIAIGRAAVGGRPFDGRDVPAEPLGHDRDGPRMGALTVERPLNEATRGRLRMIAAVARQGFDLCAARERPLQAVDAPTERPLEPLLPGFLCASAAMLRVVEQIQHMQANNLTVLITGESGTGKELVARAIHVGSPRAPAMFLPYNCTTTPRDLADSQLFGHRRGAFTGAVADQPGLVRSAAGGTLFLDEVGDLSLEVQPKLLRFLEEGEVLPVGETRPQRVDVRILAATNADLEQRVAEGQFREDLYYRLNVIRIHVPPLRERREEIPHLSALFLREASERLGKPDVELSSEALQLFVEYFWPGNVRQLRNEIHRAIALSRAGGTIGPEQLSPELAATRGATTFPLRPTKQHWGTLAGAVEQVERDLIRASLDRSGGNISETARSLGLTRRGLYLKLRRLGLEAAPEMDSK